MATVKSSVSSSVKLATCAAAIAMALGACSSDAETSASPSSTTGPSTVEFFPSDLPELPPAGPSPCPVDAPAPGGTPEWTYSGATGSVAVTGPTDTSAPLVEVQGPFTVAETQVQTLKAGDGPVVAPDATVLVCYMGVNGRDGSTFDSTYSQGSPIDFGLTQVVPGFQKAIAGQTVGSTVAVAMTSADGYPDGQPSAGIMPGDSLVFAIKILEASS